ncbi:DMT family transporter [Microbacterium sp. ASV49]|uniref:EamA family transporter n=1 Tax=Microbacterium candidum TaxID=3041922 RepID=A0ABT7N4D0_9MICO|nr:EamA family transporter [Microbacterium sp. ASV49]MDL9981557.1 EamA family transporter [Microbacterium sp. ASV49]
MEDIRRWMPVAAIAPIAWGSTYFVTREFLPDEPLWGAAIRALPAGLILLALVRRMPRGSWWWKSFVLGTLNVGAFFVLVYAAAQLLPASIASTIMAFSPVTLALVAWLLVHERPNIARLAGAAIGVAGVALMLLGGGGTINMTGVLASIAAMIMSSFGFILAKRWNQDVDVLASTAWQLAAGGLMLLPVAALLEWPPPTVDGQAVVAYAYLTLIATALAYVTWFSALKHLRGDTVGLIGLLNPVAGVLLGVLVAGDVLGPRQWAGLTLVLVGIAAPLAFRRSPTSPLTAAARSADGVPASSGQRVHRRGVF